MSLLNLNCFDLTRQGELAEMKEIMSRPYLNVFLIKGTVSLDNGSRLPVSGLRQYRVSKQGETPVTTRIEFNYRGARYFGYLEGMYGQFTAKPYGFPLPCA